MLWLVAALAVSTATRAHAQTSSAPDDQTPPPTTTQTPPPTQPPSTRPARTTSATVPNKNLFIDVNGGYQAASHDINVSASPIIYDEPAQIATTEKVKGGGLFDIAVGYRVWRDLAISLGFTSTSSSSDAQTTATIPNPIFFDQPVTRNLTASGLKHKERTINLDVVWTWPISGNQDAAVSLGPSFIRVTQDVVANVSVPAGTQDATALVETQSKTAVGFNIGGDYTYLFNHNVGIGAMARFVIGKADLTSVPSLTVGGFQIGGGVRLRF
jgi:hypothetical protein